MSQKRVILQSVGEVIYQKRGSARSIRITVAHDGTIKVSMPSWTPYSVAEAFVHSKASWIRTQQIGKGHHLLRSDERIGKAHRLKFIQEKRKSIVSRITKTEITIRFPYDLETSDAMVQTEVRKAAVRALKQEAKILLPQRLDALATKYGFTYRNVSIKQLKSRWGSCSSHKDIALNCFLMQLSWDLIDYVLLHELQHTQIMAHGPKFWSSLDQYVPNLAAKRKAIKLHKPTLITVA